MIGSNIFRLRTLAYPVHWSQQLVDHRSHRGIVPDVPKLRPLEFWIEVVMVHFLLIGTRIKLFYASLYRVCVS